MSEATLSSEAGSAARRPARRRGLTPARAAFVRRAYAHLLGAAAGFVALEVALFRSGIAARLAERMLAVPWLLVLGAFLIVGWLASRFAHRTRSTAGQYLGLVVFVVAEALLFVPMLHLAERHAPGVLASSAQITLLGFAGLTWIAWSTARDFTFLGAALRWVGVVALVLIVAALLFGFRLGVWFSLGMIAFAGLSILYDTSKILRRFPTDRPAAAGLELFASITLLFWYVLRLARRLAPR